MITYAWVCPYCGVDRTDIVDAPGPGAPKRPEVRPGGPTSPGIFEATPQCPHCGSGDAPYWEERPSEERSPSRVTLADQLMDLQESNPVPPDGPPIFYTQGPDMPEPEPRYNPHRHEPTDGCAVAAEPAGMTLDDLEVLLAHRERRGYTTGYREREAATERLVANAYDEGWRAGMSEQHDRTANAFGERVHALSELLHLLPNASVADFSEYTPVVAAVVRSLLDGHARGPYEMTEDVRRVPECRAMPEDSIVALTDRAEQLRDWLKPFLMEEMAAESTADASPPSSTEPGELSPRDKAKREVTAAIRDLQSDLDRLGS